METRQEPKYQAVDDRIMNRASGETIPDDEPVFILRARDSQAIDAIRHYFNLVDLSPHKPTEHAIAVYRRIKAFSQFRADHPERMKWPGTATSPTASTEGAE